MQTIFSAYEVVKVNGITDPQLSVKGTGFDRTLGGSEVEFRLREHLIKVSSFNCKYSDSVILNSRTLRAFSGI